jgi:hypothetical protein
MGVELVGLPSTVTSLATEGDNSEAKLTAPGPSLKCAAAGWVAGPPLRVAF